MTQHKLFRPSGSKVTIYDNNGSLLLRFTYKSKLYNISLGLENTKKNLNIAEKKAIQITQDIIFNTFQEDKYSPVRKKIGIDTKFFTSISEVLNFYEQLQPNLDSSTEESLQILNNWLSLSPSEFQDLKNLNRFFIYLKSEVKHKNSEKVGYSDRFIASHLRILRSAINLAFKYKKLETKTDITDLISTLNTQNTKEIKVYSKEEIQIIIDEAYGSRSNLQNKKTT
ncbi:Arm DNA-binding domain-containing protein [Geminocystis herdmanii]|uniref:Arm DNA-binding domain-containing protein n=1 Tax=Geminocystis herdmanii TaxID=669359 RepID=UPI00034DD2D2|nr:DUF3596 domain-containing protein [Geminocystis herdmanii]